jgi:hypothetical protein
MGMPRVVRVLALGIALALVVGIGVGAATEMFDRAAFIAKVRAAFRPLEALLPDGDELDYEHAALFSGFLNGTDEHVVIVLLTEDSISVKRAEEMGYTLDWKDVGMLPLFAIMILPPTDCIRDVEYNVPYLVRGTDWDVAQLVDARGKVARTVETWWARGADEGVYYKFSGNVKIHIQSCTTVGVNQN